MKKIGWVTSSEYRKLIPSDHPLIDELRHSFDIHAVPIVWNETDSAPNCDWIWIRTPWDYFQHLPEFLSWAQRMAATHPVLNSPTLMAWNSDKKYLFELEEKGISIPPSLLIETTDISSITRTIETCPWNEVVVKPTVSAGADNTHRFKRDRLATMSDALLRARAQSPLLVQKYMPEIETHGEASLIYFKRPGQAPLYSHAIVKKAQAGEFRIQEKFGGKNTAFNPPSAMRAFSERALAAVTDEWLYARVDLLFSEHEICLGELEMIEPELFLLQASSAEIKRAAELIASV